MLNASLNKTFPSFLGCVVVYTSVRSASSPVYPARGELELTPVGNGPVYYTPVLSYVTNTNIKTVHTVTRGNTAYMRAFVRYIQNIHTHTRVLHTTSGHLFRITIVVYV